MTAPAPMVDIRKTRVVRLRTDPPWLPEKFRNRKKRLTIKIRPFAGEKKVLKKEKWIWPSQWAPKYRTVTYGPLEGSRWDNNFMPHMRGIMDASFFPSVKIIGNCKVAQTGSSAGIETVLGFIADRQPGSAFIVYPDRDTAAKRSTDYIQPMFRKSPRLKRLLTGKSEDEASLRIRLLSMLIYMGWSGSATSLGNISARYLIGDEIDKWAEQPTKKEARSLDLFFERFRSFKYGAKAWLSSTPTLETGAIWRYLIKEAQVVFDYHVPCPHCDHMELMKFDNIKFGDERDPKKVLENKIARYVCSDCGSEWNDRQRNKALESGVWHARDDGRELFEYLEAERPEKICFHSPAWISKMVSLSECASWFLKGLKDKKDMQFFMNGIKAEAFVDYESIRLEDAIFDLRDGRPAGLVPGQGQVAALTAGVDTQDDKFYYVIRAFGYGLEQTSWLIRFGECVTFETLERILFEDHYRDADGLYYPVHLAVHDAMGHRTSEVYDFARKHPGRVQAYKGASGRRPNPRTLTTIDKYPGRNQIIPGGVQLVTCDTHHYKDELSGKLAIPAGEPGAYNMHDDITHEYATHMCGEYRNDQGLWQPPPSGARIDYWDCENMARIAADILQIKYWALPEAA